jgi:hypothetical protein
MKRSLSRCAAIIRRRLPLPPWLGPAAVASVLLAPAAAAQLAGACPPADWSRGSLETLKTAGWTVPDSARREALALALVPCLTSADPELRDGLAFEALSTWMRGQRLSAPVVAEIGHRLLPAIAPSASDSGGFAKPFAALVLAEVARVDRLHPFLAAADRAALLEGAVTYLRSVSDYRGFDARAGWRHGVAHGADLLMQLALNPALGAAQHRRILDAVTEQVAPAGAHFYAYGEGERLARPVFFIAQRGTVTASQWRDWMARLATPGPFRDWTAALATQQGLARRHNLGQFLLVLYYDLTSASNETGKRDLLPVVSAALANLPPG